MDKTRIELGEILEELKMDFKVAEICDLLEEMTYGQVEAIYYACDTQLREKKTYEIS